MQTNFEIRQPEHKSKTTHSRTINQYIKNQITQNYTITTKNMQA